MPSGFNSPHIFRVKRNEGKMILEKSTKKKLTKSNRYDKMGESLLLQGILSLWKQGHTDRNFNWSANPLMGFLRNTSPHPCSHDYILYDWKRDSAKPRTCLPTFRPFFSRLNRYFFPVLQFLRFGHGAGSPALALCILGWWPPESVGCEGLLGKTLGAVVAMSVSTTSQERRFRAVEPCLLLLLLLFKSGLGDTGCIPRYYGLITRNFGQNVARSKNSGGIS